jgi:hypothetical protein
MIDFAGEVSMSVNVLEMITHENLLFLPELLPTSNLETRQH